MDRTIGVLSDVKDLGELLQGAGIEQASLAPEGPSSGRLQLVIDGTRAMVEQPPAGGGGLFKRPKTPWTKFQLTLRHITHAAVVRAEQAPGDQSPLLACDAVPGGYRLTVRTPDGLQMVLAVDRLEGAFSDAGSVMTVH